MKSLEVKRLTKNYGKVTALKDVSFSLQPHRIYGLLGRNGAGKTTLLNILGNRLYASEGEALFDGQEVQENDAVQRRLYFMSESMPYPEGMRVSEALRLSAAFYPGFDGGRAESLLRQFHLSGKSRIKTLSTGYASIFKLIIALCCNAELLLLDEPVLGLDANHRQIFYQALLELYATSEVTVVLSTHLIEEVAEIVEDVVIIDRGAVLLTGSVEEVLQSASILVGDTASVDRAIMGQKVLSTKALGSEKAAYVMGSFVEAPEGTKASRMGLQELFVQLTNANDQEDQIYAS